MKPIALPIKFSLCTFCFFLSFMLVSAQEKHPEISKTSKNKNIILSAGMIMPIPFGNNVAHKAFTIKNGIEHSVLFHLNNHIWLGGEFSLFDADVKNPKWVGLYNDINIIMFGPKLGYRLHVSKKNKMLSTFGFGYTRYKSYRESEFDFHDDGVSLWVGSKITHQFSSAFGAYFKASYRRDFLKTSIPSIKNFFDSNYIVLSFGVQLVF